MKNYKIELEKNTEKIIEIFNKEGYEIFIVGGAIRDKLLSLEVSDWDLTTIATPEIVLKIAKQNQIQAIPTGIKHGTITYVIDDKFYEITTYRLETTYINHRKPSHIEYSNSLKEDLMRRDFTINAIAYHPEIGVVDYFNGMEDLKLKVIRSVGNPDLRLKEDALRILRAIRFSTQLNFGIVKELKIAILENKDLINYLSAERLQQEFTKIIINKNFKNGLELLLEFGLIDILIPEMTYKNTLDNKINFLNYAIESMNNSKANLKLRLAILLYDIGIIENYNEDEDLNIQYNLERKNSSNIAKIILKRFKYSNSIITDVCKLIKTPMPIYNGRYSDKDIKKLVNVLGFDRVLEFLELQKAISKTSKENNYLLELDKIKKRYELMLINNEPFEIKDLEINGSDLIELGIKQGPKIKIILEQLLELVLDDIKLNNKNKLIKFIKENII